MKKLFTLLILPLIFIGCSPDSAEKESKARKVTKYSIEQFVDNIRIFGGAFFPDEKSMLVTSNQTGIMNAYRMALPGGELTPLTNSDSTSVFGVVVFPEDNRFMISKDVGGDGNEISHLFIVEEDGSMQDVIKKPEARGSFFQWTKDNKSFFYRSTERDPRFSDIYKMTLDGYQAEMVYQNDEGVDVSAISNDEKYFAMVQAITTSANNLFLYNTETKERVSISPENSKYSYSPQYFDNAGEYLYYLTNEGGEFTYLKRYKLADGSSEKVQEYSWDISVAYESYNGRYQIIGVNEDAQTVVKIFDQQNEGKEVVFPAELNGEISTISVSRSEKWMRFSVSNAKSPSNMYLYDIEKGDLNQLTNTLNPEIKEDDLVEGKVIRYKSFDGLEIPSILYKPHEASASNQVPALVMVHGGPGGQSRIGYSPLTQYLANHGYAIIAVNNRGSSGYGKTFYEMDNQNHGEGDLQDCIWSKEYLASLGYVDTSKIGIMGGSYGGFMTMAAMAFEPEEFKVGVDIFGVTNWLRTLRSIPPWWASYKEALYEEMGDPYSEDSVRLYNISPLFHADQIKNPVMVLQGANDPRVLQPESDEIVEAVRKNNVPVEYVLFEDEGHGFQKKENEIEGFGKILEFLDTYLK
jgi:dipeptidyl aminopeptidase/acylaminoacyl peptidase